jgi:hypothetical protein
MKIIIQKKLLQVRKISFFMIVIFFFCNIQAGQAVLNFDSLFPKTWYQKGLESTIKVWHIITHVLENEGVQGVAKQQLLSDDALLGSIAFGQFCIECMHNQEQPLYEDFIYFVSVVDKIQLLLPMIVVAPGLKDHIDCMTSMVKKMYHSLVSLDI